MSVRALSSVILVVAALTAQATASHAGISLVEKPGHVTETTFVVEATPREVYDLLTDFPRWQSLFSDVLSLEVRSGGREHAQVRFKSRALEHYVTVQFDNVPGMLIRYKNVKTPLGSRARGEFRLDPIDGGLRTRITAWVYLDIVGAPGLFVRDKTIRGFRRAKLGADVTDLQRRFARTTSAPRRAEPTAKHGSNVR